jgi:iron complex outermembrane receptor protein
MDSLLLRRHGRIAASLLLVLGTLILRPGTSAAQDEAPGTSAPPPEQTPVPAEEAHAETIVVTGSRIRRKINKEGPTPVATITHEEIDKLGYTTVEEVLGNLTYNAGGSFGTGQSFSFAKGTQSVDLRGFGAGRTLILLDGRRLPVFPQGLGGTDAFVDLSTIPASLVERVEVLLDGASAIYGSDAISGVVNIITRKDIEGSQIIARYSDSDDGGGASRRIQFLQGLTSGETRIQIVGEYTKQDALKFTDRSFSKSDFDNGGVGSGFGNTFVDANTGNSLAIDPNCGLPGGALGGRGVIDADLCRFDRSEYRQFIPDSEKGSVFLRLDRKFGEINSFARFGAYRNKLVFQQEPNAFQGGDSLAFTQNRIYGPEFFDPDFGPGYVAPGAANNPTTGTGDERGGFFLRRLVEFGPRGSDQTTQAYHGLFGLQGEIGSYSWEAGFTHNEVRLESTSPTILSSVLDNEVSNNGLDLFERIPDAIVAKASHTQSEKAVSRTSGVDATFSGPLSFLPLPGGDVEFALHGDFEKQRYKDEFDAISTVGDVFDGGNGGGGDRKYTGVGLEFRMPLFQNLEFGVAGRVDSYADDSDTGKAFSPSVRTAYRPIEIVLLRASWGKSFRAPDLQRLFGANTNAFDDVIDTPLCLAAGGTPGSGADVCLPIQSVPLVIGSNANLKEETGENFNIGVVVEPIRNLTLNVDYYEIKVDDLVADLTAQQLLDVCASSGAFCDQIQRAASGPNAGFLGSPQTGGDPGAVIRANALNLSSQEIEGIDVGATYVMQVDHYGTFTHQFSWSHVRSLKVQSQPGDDYVEQIGFGQTVLLPENRYSFSTDWNFLNYGVTVRVDRVGKYPGSNALTEPARSDEFIDPYTTVDVQGRVDFGAYGLLRIGLENLFDEDFPLDPTFTADEGTPNVQNQFLGEATSYFANPLGRSGYVQYEIKF